MTEPIYEYVKGKGWVMQTPYLTINKGERYMLVRVEIRKPRIGERYASFDSEVVFNNYLDSLKRNPMAYHYSLFWLCETTDLSGLGSYFVTIVPV